jgi:arsenate reductase
MSVKIYHNPRCSKSRQTLALLEEKGISFEVKEYLKEGLEPAEIKKLWQALGDEAKGLVRVKEDEFKESAFDTEDLNIVAKKLSETPKLLERPIVVVNDKACIGRPPENVLSLFN